MDRYGFPSALCTHPDNWFDGLSRCMYEGLYNDLFGIPHQFWWLVLFGIWAAGMARHHSLVSVKDAYQEAIEDGPFEVIFLTTFFPIWYAVYLLASLVTTQKFRIELDVNRRAKAQARKKEKEDKKHQREIAALIKANNFDIETAISKLQQIIIPEHIPANSHINAIILQACREMCEIEFSQPQEHVAEILKIQHLETEIVRTFVNASSVLIKSLPKYVTLASPFTVPLKDLLTSDRSFQSIVAAFQRDDVLFNWFRKKISANYYAAESAIEAKLFEPHSPEHIRIFFAGTPFLALYDVAQAPIHPPDHLRYEGVWCVAPRGRGKTTLLSTFLQRDLSKVMEGKASLIVMDSKGDLIDHLKHNLAFAPGEQLADKLVLIEPWEHLALNPLDIPGSSDHAIKNLLYLFGAVLDTKTTPLQETLLAYLLIACKKIPNATISTMQHILSDGWEPYQKYIWELPQSQHDFFVKEFGGETYKKTRQELQWRIRKLLMEAPALEQMFRAPSTKINLEAEMDAGKVIVINNSAEILTREGSEFFARYFVALVLGAAQRRAHRAEGQKRPVYFYIDECQTVISRDEKIAVILNECRSQKIAMTFAHQAMQQITSDNVKTALADCAIRIANSDEEASILAPRLRCKPEFLRELQKGQFALFMRDYTKHPLLLTAPNNPIWTWPRMPDPDFDKIMAEQKEKWCYTPPSRGEPVRPEPEPPGPTPKKWKDKKAA